MKVIKAGNLKRMANYIKNIPQEFFTMGTYRRGDERIIECDSVGCVIGHCVKLDRSKTVPKYPNGDIHFNYWSTRFTGLEFNTKEWDWCFSADWKHFDNTPIGASKRIKWMLEHGVPENWQNQLSGYDELCYN